MILVSVQIVNLVTPIVHHYKKLYLPAFSKLASEVGIEKVAAQNSSTVLNPLNSPYTTYTQVFSNSHMSVVLVINEPLECCPRE